MMTFFTGYEHHWDRKTLKPKEDKKDFHYQVINDFVRKELPSFISKGKEILDLKLNVFFECYSLYV